MKLLYAFHEIKLQYVLLHSSICDIMNWLLNSCIISYNLFHKALANCSHTLVG